MMSLGTMQQANAQVKTRAPRQTKTLKDDVIESLRKANKDLEKELVLANKSLREAENARLRATSVVSKALEDREALYDAVRYFAEYVTNDTAPGIRVRAAARKRLEAQKIPPPSALGNSRQRKRRKKRLTEEAPSAQ